MNDFLDALGGFGVQVQGLRTAHEQAARAARQRGQERLQQLAADRAGVDDRERVAAAAVAAEIEAEVSSEGGSVSGDEELRGEEREADDPEQ